MKNENKKKGKMPLFFLTNYFVTVFVINWYLEVLENCFNSSYGAAKKFIEILLLGFSNGIVFIICISSSIILLLLIHNIKNTIKNSNIEIEGIPLKKKDGTFGTADWASESEMQEYLSIGKRDGIILGKTEDNQVITLPMNTYLNKNIAVFGASRK